MAQNMQNRGLWTKPTGPRRNTGRGRKNKRLEEAGDEDENVIDSKDGRENKRLREAGDEDKNVIDTKDHKFVSGGGEEEVPSLKTLELNQEIKDSWSSEPGLGERYIQQLPPGTIVFTRQDAAVFASPEFNGVRRVDILVREHARGKGQGGACFRAAANNLLRGSCNRLQLDHICTGDDFQRLKKMVQNLPGMLCQPTIGGWERTHGTWMVTRLSENGHNDEQEDKEDKEKKDEKEEESGGGGGGSEKEGGGEGAQGGGGGSEKEGGGEGAQGGGGGSEEEEEEEKKGKRKRARAIDEEEEPDEAGKESRPQRRRRTIESDKDSDDE